MNPLFEEFDDGFGYKYTARLGNRACHANTRRAAWTALLLWRLKALLAYVYRSTDGTYKWCPRGFIPDDLEDRVT